MDYFTLFKKDIKGIELPKKFTFPFYYEPHELSKIASDELQEYLQSNNKLNHSFGINNDQEIGKMFGVLVVKNQNGELGYLAAFSGNMEGQNKLKRFIPPIYDIHSKDSFFQKDNKELIELSQEIQYLETDKHYLELQQIVKKNNQTANRIIEEERLKLKKRKQHRKQLKQSNNSKSDKLKKQLAQQSLHDNFYLKELICYYQDKYSKQQEELNIYNNKLRKFKRLRNEKSNALHKKIFEQYHFLNKKKISKSLLSIFNELQLQAPAGTGDCAAPKLLQYAFLNQLQPIAMAEFWWGKSGNSKIRKHQQFYPSCNGKCKPILAHMLEGMELEENLLLKNLAKNKTIEIIYEDDCLIVINKPNELLTVSGKTIKDSVYTRFAEKYPKSKEFLIVHRLDMSTSGILLLTKTKKSHQFLQKQFIEKTIQKKYVALLDGIIDNNEGEINLPLRVDLDDRPKQLVCFEFGKKAKTKWKVLERINNKTRIKFTPITGRTHQLRVHAAHQLGLNTAIVGDDLYGKKADRLHLHALFIKFIHPTSKKEMEFASTIPF